MSERWAGPGPLERPAGPGPGPFAISGNFLQKMRPEKMTCYLLEIVRLSMPSKSHFLEPSKKTGINQIYISPVASGQDLSWQPHW